MSKAQIYKSETAPITNTLIAKLMVIRDVRTRWNYTHAMKRALILRKVLFNFSHLCSRLIS